MLAANHHPLIIAHRGAKKYAPENTMAAFRLAVEQGADGIEFDARLSSDGEVVILHDETLDRTTNGKGRVNSLSLEELKRLDAGSFFGPEFSGERIPTLREVFETLDSGLLFDIEITDYLDLFGPLAARVVHLVKEYGLHDRVFLSSFNPRAVSVARRIGPECECGLIALGGVKGVIQRSWVGRGICPQMIFPVWKDIDRAYVEREHKKQRKVIPWTANTRETIRQLADWQVDGFITDVPDLAVETLRDI